MSVARLNYVELPVSNITASKAFFESVAGWSLQDFAPTYAATMTGDVDLGLQADRAEATSAPLPVIQVSDLDSLYEAVLARGDAIIRPIFSFPGGRRFHVREPSGNEIAFWQLAAEE